jgi:XTP/dITP diphosphohydrolase
MLPNLFLGTPNPVKIAIVQAAILSLPVEILTPPDLQINIQIEETWHTTLENARIKARAYCEVTNLPTLAIDGGLWIEKFPAEKQPGAKVKKIGMTDEDLLDYYLRELDKNNVTAQPQGLFLESLAAPA